MDYYFLNNKPQSNGDHEVHKEDCQHLPEDRTYLGFFASCNEAVAEAQKKHPQSNGCKVCAYSCHTN